MMVSYQQKLETVLKTTEWSKDKLADLLDVSNATFSHWVNGKAEPEEAHAKKIDKLFIKCTDGLRDKLEYTRREYIESLEKSFHRHVIYELDKNNKS